MTEATQKTVNDALKGLNVDDDSSSSKTKKLGEGKYDVKTADSYDDKQELKKLNQQEAQLKQNLHQEGQDMSSVEKDFSKGHEEEIKMEKKLNEFKKAAADAKKLGKDDDTSPTDELGEDSVHDYGHEMDELVHMSQDQPTGVTREQARHLETDYHRVATKYLKNVENIMNIH